MTMEIIPQLKDISKSLENDLADIDEAADMVNSITIKTQADLKLAVQMTATIKESFNEIDAKREHWVVPLKAVIKDIDATFAPALTALENAEKKLKGKIVDCVEANETERLELLGQVADASDSRRKDLLAKADALVLDKVPGLQIRTTKAVEVEDPAAVIQFAIDKGMMQLLEVDMKALKAIVKEYGDALKIPGVKIEDRRSVAITVKDVK